MGVSSFIINNNKRAIRNNCMRSQLHIFDEVNKLEIDLDDERTKNMLMNYKCILLFFLLIIAIIIKYIYHNVKTICVNFFAHYI